MCHFLINNIWFVRTGMPEEAGSQTVSGCLPAEACPEDHQIPTHAEGVLRGYKM